MECSEFLKRFSDFYDAPPESRLRRRAEAHVEDCERCARYQRTVERGAALLRALPRIQPSESFRTGLEHRLFHLEDETAFARAGGASAVPVLTAVGVAVVMAIVAWFPTLGRSVVEVDLAPIVVSDPPSRRPVFEAGLGGFPAREPTPELGKGLWSDPNALLLEYSPILERYRAEGLLRQTGF